MSYILGPLLLLFVVPSLIVVLVLGCLIVRFKIHRWFVFRWINFPLLAISIPILAFASGIATGYLDAWIAHQYWQAGASEQWYDKLGFPGWPGDMIANVFWGDWQEDEEWLQRDKIAFWNGCFWASFGFVALPLIYLVYRNSLHPDLHPPQSNGARVDESARTEGNA